MGNGKDHYYNKSKQEGYRTRAAYKLQQIDDQFDVLFGGASAHAARSSAWTSSASTQSKTSRPVWRHSGAT